MATKTGAIQHKKSAVIFGLRGTITVGGVKIKKPQRRNSKEQKDKIEHNSKRLDEFYVRDKVVSRISWSHIQ